MDEQYTADDLQEQDDPMAEPAEPDYQPDYPSDEQDAPADAAQEPADAAEYQPTQDTSEYPPSEAPDYRRLQEEVAVLREREMDRLLEHDLAAIKQHNPKETAGSIYELGPVFLRLMMASEQAGERFDPIDAYEAVRAVNARRAPPPSMGFVGGAVTQPENRIASMSAEDFEKMVAAAERGELMKG